MKRLSMVALALLLPMAALAADAPKPQLFMIHEEIAVPGAIQQYEGVTKDLIKAFAEKKVTSPSFVVNTYMTADLHYLYLTPIANWGQIETAYKDWMGLADVIGKDRFADLTKRGSASMVSYSDVVAARRDDLSYVPDNPRLKPDEATFGRLEYYYLKPGTEQEAEQICRDYIALFKSKNIPDGFTIYMAMSGTDLPLLVAVVTAKSPADFAMADQKNTATLGDALRALQARALSVTRRLERKDSFYRPDLSYMPVSMK